eukprot:gene1241-11330_t
MQREQTFEVVKEYYGKILSTMDDLKTTACTCSGKPTKIIREIIKDIPNEIKEKFYGCGTPTPLGIEGCSVLDLGSGSGRDCYIASKLVGKEGKVIGVDMTQEQNDVANKFIKEYSDKLGYSNMRFETGYIEFLDQCGIEKESIDIVISNCVINLSPNKEEVLKSVYDSLKFGGEFYFSDVYASRRIPEEIQKHEVLYGECLSGALYIEDFIRLCHKVGFIDPRMLEMKEIKIKNEELQEVIGNIKFYSITYRLFKLKNLETKCEDYGQYAIYKGNIVGQPSSFELDDHHFFETNKPLLVCGNTASMLQETWLSKYFNVIGDRKVHYGLFQDCYSGDKKTGNNDCSGGSCC